MKDASLSKSLSSQSGASAADEGAVHDIPVAQRDGAVHTPEPVAPRLSLSAALESVSKLLQRRFWLWGLIGFVAALQLGLVSRSIWVRTDAGLAYQPAEAGLETALGQLPLTPADSLLGHAPYAEAPRNTLSPIGPKGSILLRDAAAERFLAMTKAARADKVKLVPLSGFRSVEEQTYLFFTLKAKQGLSAKERAQVSAPPGYSEHHTGYAVDIGDGDRPNADLEIQFEETGAFRWLQTNAARFGFEMSFSENNPQGVSYEPWHWRFVGDRHSLETFYKR